MKKLERIKQSKSYAIGYEQGKKDTIERVRGFIDKEAKFLPDIYSDKLLDRLAYFIKKI